MIDITKDIQPLTTFRNNSVKFMKRLKKTWRPIILTVNGKPEAVVQSAAEYQRLLNLAALADPEEGLRQGLEDIAKGRTRPAREVFAELRLLENETADLGAPRENIRPNRKPER